MNNIRQLYASIAWPNAVGWAAIIQSGNAVGSYFDLFDPNVQGVIDPLGTVSGFEGTAEYFVGSVWTGIGRVVAAPFHRIIAKGNVVFIDVDINFAQYASATDTTPLFYWNLTQTGTFTFSDNNQILLVDLVIRNVELSVGFFNPNTPAYKQQLCAIILDIAGCNSTYDPAGFYTDFNDCYNYVNAIDFGTWDDVRQNSTICRVYHGTLAILRPQVHCPHVGKTGGDKCIPHTAQEWYAERPN